MKQVYTFDGLFDASKTQARDYSIRTLETWAKWEDNEENQCKRISDLLLSQQEEEEEEEEETEAEKEINHFMNSDITW
jgi:hypothetical protein